MTPKEKAEDLISKFYPHTKTWDCWSDMPEKKNNPKKCALIAVEEIILTLNKDIKDLDVRGNVLLDLIHYWKEVKSYLK